MRARSHYLAVLVAACALLVAGCGSDDSDNGDSGGSGSGDSGSDESAGGGGAYGNTGGDETEKKASGGSGGGATLKLVADPSGALKFDKTTLEGKPGKTEVVLDNPSDVPHAIEVEGSGVEAEGETVGKGGVSQVTVKLKPGEYEYYCPVGNHREAGMEGTLTVR
jgi:plastocyanin